MLVLTRKVGEKIHIGDDIVVTLLEIKGNRIRLGVEAPLSVPVLRSELMDKDLAALQVAEAGTP
jgi:carbon storage regulator